MAENGMITVLCVDDSTDITRLYQRLIDAQPGMRCVATLGSADRLVEVARESGAGVVLLDLNMAGRDPLDAMQELGAVRPECRVLVFSGDDADAEVDRAIEAGAWGLVSKSSGADEVLGAIRRVARGESVLPR